jgi:kinesin family protein 2/24
MQLLEQAAAQRTTRATQVNDTSSRSHAVYRIWLGSTGSVLTLVDCAGSERREDSSHHDAQSRKDAAEINSTIFALKECFRVMRSSKGQQPPYRDSLLTRVLSDSFASENALIMAIGTVSPSASDTEHSIGTLRALQQLQGTQMTMESREDVLKPKVQEDLPHPRNWSEDEVRQWLECALNGCARRHAAGITKGTDGKNLVRWPQMRFTQLCGGDDDLGARLYQDLRQKIRSAGA